MQEDRLLVERARKGDAAALHRLIRKHQERAYGYAFRLTRNPEEAGDIVAEAFVRVHNAVRNFKGNSAFTTWLYRIITNCYLDHRKKERTRQALSLDAPVPGNEDEGTREIEDDTYMPDRDVESLQRGVLVDKALRRLPDFQRAMIVMYHMEELSYEEIAESLDLPLGTVKSRLNRARISLRELLAKHEDLFRVG
ncbi:sigma-70 family RNA polymerase sigma factor [bacterium]|nr:MAG: sigma-70 family RNA polymerase sigma factor [bacterium]